MQVHLNNAMYACGCLYVSHLEMQSSLYGATVYKKYGGIKLTMYTKAYVAI